MTKNNRQKAIEELKETQERYLSTVSANYSPQERKPIIEDSMERFKKCLEAAESGAMTDEDLTSLITTITKGIKDSTLPKGLCSKDCLVTLLKSQDLVTCSALKANLPQEAFLAILELTNSMLADTIAAMVLMANGSEKTWEVRERVHETLNASTQSFGSLSDVIKAGRVLTMKLPSVDSSKYKQFMN